MSSLVKFIRETYQTNAFIPLHAPTFEGNEQAYVAETIASTFVSSVGKFVTDFEQKIEAFTQSPKAIATSSGSSALHTALYLAGVTHGDLVITQALTFVATCNTLYHMGAAPIFVDISTVSLGLSPQAVQDYLEEHGILNENGLCVHKETGQIIRAVMPMHTFGHPVELDELVLICQQWNLILIEDAAESLGSRYKDKHTGTLGEFAALSFNGNKIITTGGGGMVLTNNQEGGIRAKHITTTAKVPHPYEFYHDEPGFNYRMPNLNAALGCAQMESLPRFIEQKRALAKHYQAFFDDSDLQFVLEPPYAKSNYWLNAVICPNTYRRDELLKSTNESGVMTRPVWQLMHRLPMFKDALRGPLQHSELVESCLINLPSSPTTIGLTHA
ncbi:LegC family aminotransferase [Shewanella sp. D64]|uniref:LegC family aminotransferase n=1 Tax=unclassified Shewanella TaxID=196818 RepID=UPI0022BA4B6D|nr:MULTISPECIES: LegC family aminotransferase [unclassified Shewanella]MEC4726559.1 LegC family aminotransferase [Shewanella sp. D64]MEC4737400.1 LegC family aminotransferase [Shewanella sp. E94]WBJ97219.1 LegC family aminotransferase [Shewanella sp. MTB7]